MSGGGPRGGDQVCSAKKKQVLRSLNGGMRLQLLVLGVLASGGVLGSRYHQQGKDKTICVVEGCWDLLLFLLLSSALTRRQLTTG